MIMHGAGINFESAGPPVYPELVPDMAGEFTTPSGNRLVVKTTARNVTIYDPSVHVTADPDTWVYGVSVSVSPRNGVDEIHATTITRDLQHNPLQRHPDLVPYEIIAKSLGYFRRHGLNPTAARTCWPNVPRLRTNWDAFWARAEHTGMQDSDLAIAARQTPSGVLWARVGYPEVQKVYTDQHSVRVIFSRDKQEDA